MPAAPKTSSAPVVASSGVLWPVFVPPLPAGAAVAVGAVVAPGVASATRNVNEAERPPSCESCTVYSPRGSGTPDWLMSSPE